MRKGSTNTGFWIKRQSVRDGLEGEIGQHRCELGSSDDEGRPWVCHQHHCGLTGCEESEEKEAGSPHFWLGKLADGIIPRQSKGRTSKGGPDLGRDEFRFGHVEFEVPVGCQVGYLECARGSGLRIPI